MQKKRERDKLGIHLTSSNEIARAYCLGILVHRKLHGLQAGVQTAAREDARCVDTHTVGGKT